MSTRRDILLALVLLLCYGFFQQSPGWNETSRYDLVRALVEDGTTQIDRFQKNTGDKALYAGHYYSDKAPGTALLGVPVYKSLRVVYHRLDAGEPGSKAAIQALAMAESGIPTTLLVLLLIRFLRPAVGEVWALAIGVGYGLGSMAWPYATLFFGHAASTFCLFAAFYLLWRWRERPNPWRPLVSGALAGCAVLVEMPVVLGVAILGCYALWLGRGQALRFVLGGIPALLVLLAYNLLTFGGPFTVGYEYSTGFGSLNEQGIISVVLPSWTTASALLFGPRGLVRFAPWFALAPLGILAARRSAVRAEVIVAAAVCCAFLIYNSGALNPFGGWTPGPRYLLPSLPFAAILVAVSPPKLRIPTTLLLVFAIGVFFSATATVPSVPTTYGDPLIDLWLPHLLAGQIVPTIASERWGMSSVQALTVLGLAVAGGGAAILATFRPHAAANRATAFVTSILAALVIAFAVPFWP